MPVAPARAAVASAVPPIAAAASPVPAVPVAMPTRPAQPAPAPPGDLAAAAAPDGPPPSTATVPGGPGYEGAAPDLHQDGDPDDRPTPSGRAAGWSTASVLGRGVGPGGAAPAATDVVAALDRAGTVAGLSGSALFTGLVPPEPPSPVDDLPPATTWADEVPAADPAPAVGDDTSPADPGPTEGSEPHPWFGAGRHSRPEGAPSSPVTGAPGPGRHTSTPATAPVPPSPPQQPRPADPTASAVHPVAERPRPVPHPRAAQAPVDRVVAAALQGVGAAVPQPAPWASPSLFEPPGPRDRDDLTERAEDPTGSTTPPIPGARSAPDAATPPAAGRDGGNPVDPGR
ncbi:phage Tail collar [Pseudonocardia sp. N23]|nr:phage Tail collar [Pseudonocardia sp. N23]